MRPTAVLRSLQTIVPDTVLVQDEVRDVFAAQPDIGRLAQRIVGASFNGSGIDTRHTVIDELSLTAHPDDPQFFDIATGRLLSPGTKTRNEVYVREAAGFDKNKLGVQLMRDAFKVGGPLADADEVPAEQEAVLSLFVGAIGVEGDGVMAGPTSTVIGCSVLNWLMLAVIDWLKTEGHPLPLLRSQNLPGAIEHNRALGRRYQGRLSRQLA